MVLPQPPGPPAAPSGFGPRGPLPGDVPHLGPAEGTAPGLGPARRHPVPVQPRPPLGPAGFRDRVRVPGLVGPGPGRLLGSHGPRLGDPVRPTLRSRGRPDRRAGTPPLVP